MNNAAATTITFSGLGAVVGAAPLRRVEIDSSILAAADSRELRVTIGLGGNVKMCAPYLVAGSSPQAC